jgi:hypothetical protein
MGEKQDFESLKILKNKERGERKYKKIKKKLDLEVILKL